MPTRDSTILLPCSVPGEVPVASCLFGACNGSFVPACVCWEGYRHDRMVGRYNNCGLPNWIPWLGGALSFLTTFLGFSYGLYVALYRSVPRSMAWSVAASASFASIMFFAATLCLHTQASLEMPVYGALFNNVGTAAIAYAIGVMVVIALAPVDRFSKARLGMKFFRRFMMYVLPGFLMVTTTICTIVGYAMDDEQTVTDAMGAVYAIFSFAALCACPIMFHHMRNFVRVLDDAINLQNGSRQATTDGEEEASSPRPASDRKGSFALFMQRSTIPKTSTDIIVELRIKIMALLITSTVSSFTVFVVCLVCASFQFSARTVPLSWLVYYCITCGIGLFAIQLSFAAQRNGGAVNPLKHSSRQDMSPRAEQGGSAIVSITASPVSGVT